jgi:hypothetical protein
VGLASTWMRGGRFSLGMKKALQGGELGTMI